VKKLKKTVLLCFLGLTCFYYSKIQAQNIQIITPDNVETSADEIAAYLGARLNISQTKIEDFYLDHWEDVTYDDTQIPPEATALDSDNQSISFEWSTLPAESNLTLVGYLNLSDESMLLGENTIQNDITLNVPNDLYLFTFQRSSPSNQRGNLFSIIIEKPVLLMQQKSCNCKLHSEVWSSNIETKKGGMISSGSYPWAPLADQEYYYCVINFDNWPSASFRSRIIFEGETPTRVGINGQCLENIRVNSSGTMIEVYNEENENHILGTVAFAINPYTEPQLPEFTYFASNAFESSLNNTGTIDLYRCIGKEGIGGKKRAGVKGLSNDHQSKLSLSELSGSFNSHKNIQYILPEDGSISLALYDSYGRIVNQVKDQTYTQAGTHNIMVDLSQQASGFYFCILKTENEMVNLKLINVK